MVCVFFRVFRLSLSVHLQDVSPRVIRWKIILYLVEIYVFIAARLCSLRNLFKRLAEVCFFLLFCLFLSLHLSDEAFPRFFCNFLIESGSRCPFDLV